nr:hypothetical protein CFP56_01398 [Quercus suber]
MLSIHKNSLYTAIIVVVMAITSHTTCIAEALYAVFVARSTRRATAFPLLQAKLHIHPNQLQSRALSTTKPKLLSRVPKPPERRAQRWNSEISHRLITLVNPDTNQPEHRPRTKFDVLLALDEKTHRLVQLTPDPYPLPSDFIPLCKIVSKKEEYDRERARKVQQKDLRKAKLLESSVKTLEINWAVAPNDLGHRLDKFRGFLEEGRKVDIVLAVKKRGQKATLEQSAEVLKKIRKVVDDVSGARELKPMQGDVGAFVTLSFQGKPLTVGKKVVEAKEEAADTVPAEKKAA